MIQLNSELSEGSVTLCVIEQDLSHLESHSLYVENGLLVTIS